MQGFCFILKMIEQHKVKNNQNNFKLIQIKYCLAFFLLQHLYPRPQSFQVCLMILSIHQAPIQADHWQRTLRKSSIQCEYCCQHFQVSWSRQVWAQLIRNQHLKYFSFCLDQYLIFVVQISCVQVPSILSLIALLLQPP